MSDQSELGKELNRIVRETGMSPLQVMKRAMGVAVLDVGNHVFVAKGEGDCDGEKGGSKK